MTIEWPENLPQHFLRQGNQETFGDGRVVSQNQKGPPKMRPGSSAMPRPFSASMRMTQTQLDAFIIFVEETLARGTLPFTIASTRADAEWLVQFSPTAAPAWSEIGNGRWNVSMSLTILRDIPA